MFLFYFFAIAAACGETETNKWAIMVEQGARVLEEYLSPVLVRRRAPCVISVGSTG